MSSFDPQNEPEYSTCPDCGEDFIRECEWCKKRREDIEKFEERKKWTARQWLEAVQSGELPQQDCMVCRYPIVTKQYADLEGHRECAERLDLWLKLR